MSDELRWGIIGTARIARSEVGPAIVLAERARLVAVASRRLESAQALARDLRGAQAYGSYAALLADPEVDVVYIALPNTLHREWVIAALRAGKHVLCEKPLGMSADEVLEMASVAESSGRLLLEGFMWRFHPRIRRIRDLVASNAIGEVKLLRSTYAVRSAGMDDPDFATSSIRYAPSLGGGALADLGCYCVDALQFFTDAAPLRVWSCRSAPEGVAVETSVSGELEFPGGVVGQFFATMESSTGASLEIIGTTGSIRMSKAFRIRAADETLTIELQTAEGVSHETFAFEDQYRLEIEHVGMIVRGLASPQIPLLESLRTARTLDMIRHAWAGHAPAPRGSQSESRLSRN